MSIKIENLSYIYSPRTTFAKTALDNISFEINDGDFFGIIGHTGSGKSTLISHFNGLTKLTSGKIYVDEFDLSAKYDYKKLRAKVGMVFQYPEYQLFDETVALDVAFGPKNLGLGTEEVNKRVREAIEMVGLDYESVAPRSPFELSGGQKRRVALAGVLAMQPKILILDEPTAGLDPRGKQEILELIKRIKKYCPTIVMISHNMDEIASYCNRIAVLNQGRLECVLSPKELFVNAKLLQSLGLDIPIITSIAHKLSDNGFNIDKSALTIDEIIEQILQVVPSANASCGDLAPSSDEISASHIVRRDNTFVDNSKDNTFVDNNKDNKDNKDNALIDNSKDNTFVDNNKDNSKDNSRSGGSQE